MSKSILKIICVITIFSMTVAFIIGSIALVRSTDYLTAEIKGKIVSTAENYSHDFSSKFNHMEGLTDSLASHVSTTFDYTAFEKDPDGYLKFYKSQLADMIKKTLSTTSNAHSLYVTFNPQMTAHNDEVWYAIVDGSIQKISADFKSNKRDFQLPYAKDMAYFFEPQQQQTGTWISPYFDRDLNQEVLSYSRAIYINHIFIGVAGADITTEDTINAVSRMKLYKSGYSALLDETFNFVIYPGRNVSHTETRLSRILQQELRKSSSRSGSLEYSYKDQPQILGYSRLDNGWTLAITQPAAEAFAPIRSLSKVMMALGLILAIVLIAFLIVFSIPFIKKQHSLEEENREKEIMLIYQSRQAKTGEMMGNITHQWKQPLNTINLILANLLDSYRYGDLDEERLQKSVSKVEHIVEKMSDTITDFSDFLKPSKEKVGFDAADCIKSALALMEESINYHQIRIETCFEGSTKAFGYPNELTHVIFNILNNARDAIINSNPQQRTILVQTNAQDEKLTLSIANPGDPIAPEAMSHLFEPYFTTKSGSGGTGLGLYISRQIIEQRMDGRLFLKNTADGVCCHIEIPAV